MSNRSSSCAWLAAALLLCGTAAAQDTDIEMPRALKVCADPNNLPFSNDRGEGFENRIAALIAARLNLPLEVFYYPQRMNIVRNTIRYRLPGESEYRCDLLTGVPAEFSAAATTRPYFRSTYVLVYARGRQLDVASAGQFLALDPALLAKLKIGVYDRSPAVEWLRRHNLIDRAVPYRMLNPDPAHYPGRIIDHDLVEGTIDAAIIWGPIGGYYAHRAKGADLAVIPLHSEPGVRFDYAVAMGVRQGEPQWLQRVDQALAQDRGEILRLLHEYDVPLVDETGALLQ